MPGCNAPEAQPTPAPMVEVSTQPKREEATLWFGGDVHLGASARGGMEGIASILGGAAGVVNLEGPLAEGAGGARIEGARVWLANPVDTPSWLRAAGIVAVSVANNHAADGGPAGRARTISGLREAGVAPVGGTAGSARLDIRGTVVTLLAHEVEEPGLAEVLAAELRAGEGTPRVVALHVSGARSYLPSPALQAAVAAAVAGGADVVVAHGTHVIGPVERRDGAVIAWGLGNLLFDCVCTAEAEALVLRVTLGPEGPGVAEIVPVTAGLGGAGVTPARDAAGVYDLLDAIGSAPLTRLGDRAWF
ncbi:MAG: CapA family protein [Pseudomonadota bacterium]|nr:CapA family protein [Pseudomonadota bacterium]